MNIGQSGSEFPARAAPASSSAEEELERYVLNGAELLARGEGAGPSPVELRARLPKGDPIVVIARGELRGARIVVRGDGIERHGASTRLDDGGLELALGRPPADVDAGISIEGVKPSAGRYALHVLRVSPNIPLRAGTRALDELEAEPLLPWRFGGRDSSTPHRARTTLEGAPVALPLEAGRCFAVQVRLAAGAALDPHLARVVFSTTSTASEDRFDALPDTSGYRAVFCRAPGAAGDLAIALRARGTADPRDVPTGRGPCELVVRGFDGPFRNVPTVR